MQATPNRTTFFPPSIEEVRIYFNRHGLPAAEAECYFLFCGFKHWKNNKGKYPRNWKQSAYNWIKSILGKKYKKLDSKTARTDSKKRCSQSIP